MINPYAILAAVLFWLASVAGAYWWGSSSASDACAAKAGKASAKVEAAEDRRDAAIDDIGADTRTAVDNERNLNKGRTNESAQRIRTVVVPGDCRRIDPAIVRELQQATDDANAALGVGMRPAPAGPAAADP